jgi:small neutral amino acid transporter SnatA (MarC family)
VSTVALLLAAVNPAAIAVAVPRVALREVPARLALAVTAIAAAVLAGVSEPLLDWLDVSAPTFRLAAGVVLGLAAGRWVLLGAKPLDTVDGLSILTVALSPQLAAVSITEGTEVGAVPVGVATVVALAAALAAVVVQNRPATAVWSWAARLVGVAGVALAVDLIVDGVKTV